MLKASETPIATAWAVPLPTTTAAAAASTDAVMVAALLAETVMLP